MKYALLALALIAAPAGAQNGKFNVDLEGQQRRVEFERFCRLHAPTAEPARREWLASCKREAP